MAFETIDEEHMDLHEFDVIKLKDGRTGTVVDFLGNDYVVDIGTDESNWDTIVVSEDEIDSLVQRKSE